MAEGGTGPKAREEIRPSQSNKENSKFLLTHELRTEIEKNCKRILNEDNFGREKFRSFCNLMRTLVTDGNTEGFAELRDTEAKYTIHVNKESISVHGEQVNVGGAHSVKSEFYQRVSYEPGKKGFGLFGTGKSMPILRTRTSVQVPDIKFYSYFHGQSRSAFPLGTQNVERDEQVSDEEVQAICEEPFRYMI